LSHPNEKNLPFTKALPSQHGVQYFSLAEIESKAATLKSQGVEIVGYDLEREYSPARDLRNPIASVSIVSQIVHKYDMKLMVSPSRELTELYGSRFAMFVDIYNIQAQSLQSTPNDYQMLVDKVAQNLRLANPDLEVFSQVSTARGSLESMKESALLVGEIVDGMTAWYSLDEKGLGKLESFVKWFHDNYSSMS
jgi:hypothetical protein